MADCLEEFEEYVVVRSDPSRKSFDNKEIFDVVCVKKDGLLEKNLYDGFDIIAILPNLSFKVDFYDEKDQQAKEKDDDKTKTTSWAIPTLGVDSSPYTGKGVKVAIIDDGIQKDHDCFTGRIIKGYNFVNNSEKLEKRSHGTQMTSLICGAPFKKEDQIFRTGIAPGIEDLFFYCVIDEENRTDVYRFLSALNCAYNTRVDIVSISHHFSFDRFTSLCNSTVGEKNSVSAYLFAKVAIEFDRVLKRFTDNFPVLIFVASGNDSDRDQGDHQLFTSGLLALLQQTITIGNLEQKSVSLELFKSSNILLDFVMPGHECLAATSGSKTDTKNSGGTSAATANAAGIAALWLEFLKEHPHPMFSRNQVFELLKQHSTKKDISDLTRYPNPKAHFGFGYILAPTKQTSNYNTMAEKEKNIEKTSTTTTGHDFHIKNECELPLKIEVWNDSNTRRPVFGGRFTRPPEQKVTITQQDTKTVKLYKSTAVDVLVSKQDEIDLAIQNKLLDTGIVLKVDYERKEDSLKDPGYIIVNHETKLCTIDRDAFTRYSFTFEKVGIGGSQTHHISGNVGHPGGGG